MRVDRYVIFLSSPSWSTFHSCPAISIQSAFPDYTVPYPNIAVPSSSGQTTLPVRLKMRRIDGLVLIVPCYKDRSGLHGCCARQLKAGLEGKLAIVVVRKLSAGYAAAGKLSSRCLVAVL